MQDAGCKRFKVQRCKRFIGNRVPGFKIKVERSSFNAIYRIRWMQVNGITMAIEIDFNSANRELETNKGAGSRTRPPGNVWCEGLLFLLDTPNFRNVSTNVFLFKVPGSWRVARQKICSCNLNGEREPTFSAVSRLLHPVSCILLPATNNLLSAITMDIKRPSPTKSVDDAVQFLKGIGPRRSEMLAAHGIRTIGDFLGYIPFRYEDRTQFRPIQSLREGEWGLICGEVCSVGGFDTRRRGFSVFEMLVRDGKGSVRVKFFNQPYLRQVYKVGIRLIIYGQVKKDPYAHGSLVFMNPECEILEEEQLRNIRALGACGPDLSQTGRPADTHVAPDHVCNPFAACLRIFRTQFPHISLQETAASSKVKGVAAASFSQTQERIPGERQKELDLLNAGLSPAHKRLIFEELFQLQVGIAMVRQNRVRHVKDRKFQLGESIRLAIKRSSPFTRPRPRSARSRTLPMTSAPRTR